MTSSRSTALAVSAVGYHLELPSADVGSRLGEGNDFTGFILRDSWLIARLE